MRYRYAVLAAFVTSMALASASAQRGEPPPLPAPIRQDRPAAPQPGYEVQTRGPVHEAFLEPIDTLPPPRVVRQPPPGEILEAPPELRPEAGVVWISGYWAWDDDANRYVWVSGVWRVPPADKVWLPGRWQSGTDGWQWIGGAWLSAEEEQQLLPPPPPPQPEQPPALAAGQIFVPGAWVYRGDRYAWRPGFPLSIPAGWVWTNARYVNTPAGSLFAEGYWDLPVQDRGLLFSPVAFPNAAVGRSIEYLPRHVVGADSLLGALFVNARTSQYYYGDYFDPRYKQAGYVPWMQYRVRDVGANPLYGYYRQYGERGWIDTMQGLYTARYSGTGQRAAYVMPMDEYVRSGKKLKKVAPDERTYYQQTAQTYAAAAQQFYRYEQEFVAQRRAVPLAPVAVPFQPWGKGHPHGMPPGQAKKLQPPAFPVPGFDDGHKPGKKPKKDKN
jgi:WXXGXW repeat (2 copies)